MAAVISENFLVCGCCKLSRRKQIAKQHFDSASGAEDWNPRFNVAPPQPVPVIRRRPKGVRAGILTNAFYRASDSHPAGLPRSDKSDV
jgi:putative SOS response-associated peptidase YedK